MEIFSAELTGTDCRCRSHFALPLLRSLSLLWASVIFSSVVNKTYAPLIDRSQDALGVWGICIDSASLPAPHSEPVLEAMVVSILLAGSR